MKNCNMPFIGEITGPDHRCNRSMDHYGAHECYCGFRWERSELRAENRPGHPVESLAQADGDSATGARRS